jgi:hypothetical protein
MERITDLEIIDIIDLDTSRENVAEHEDPNLIGAIGNTVQSNQAHDETLGVLSKMLHVEYNSQAHAERYNRYKEHDKTEKNRPQRN